MSKTDRLIRVPDLQACYLSYCNCLPVSSPEGLSLHSVSIPSSVRFISKLHILGVGRADMQEPSSHCCCCCFYTCSSFLELLLMLPMPTAWALVTRLLMGGKRRGTIARVGEEASLWRRRSLTSAHRAFFVRNKIPRRLGIKRFLSREDILHTIKFVRLLCHDMM